MVLDPALKVGFSMRRYQQFGTLRSLYRWLYIVYHGGESTKYQVLQAGVPLNGWWRMGGTTQCGGDDFSTGCGNA